MTDLLRLIKEANADGTNKVNLMVGRGLIVAANDDSAIQTAQVGFMADEPADDVERIQEYGFTSVPLQGAECVAVFVGGNRDHGLLVAVDDRRYRLQGLKGGEVAIYDDLGQKVHLTRSGIVVDGGGLPITIQNTPEVDMQTPLVKMSGDLQVAGDVTVGGDMTAGGDVAALGEVRDHGTKSMSAMRGVYNDHDHANPEGGRVAKDQGKM